MVICGLHGLVVPNRCLCRTSVLGAIEYMVLMDKQMILEHAKWYPPLNAAFAVLPAVHLAVMSMCVFRYFTSLLCQKTCSSQPSHENRTPLNGIIGCIQLLEFELKEQLLQNVTKETIQSANHSSLLLNLLVNNAMTKGEDHTLV